MDGFPYHDTHYEEESDSGTTSKSSSMMIPPSVLIQGCTPPSDEELALSVDLLAENRANECE